ncbi:MAG: hypothetical protein P8171_24770 [Candidatus Thiodiazotropha sp.]
MPEQTESAKLTKQAEHLLVSGQFGGDTASRNGRVGDPIPVLNPNGARHAWFIPVTLGERIAGFFLFSPDARLLSYSSFQHRKGELDTCPLSATWTDKKAILQVAGKGMLDDERVRDIYLGYDGEPSRLAWVIETELPGGQTRTLYVAGNSVWSAPKQGR